MKKGDKVKIVDVGEHYSGYEKMFKAMGDKNTEPRDTSPSTHDTYTILNVKKHLNYDDMLALIENPAGKTFLMGVEGLEVVRQNLKKVTELGDMDVIHCPTLEEAELICGLMHEAHLKWCDGASYTNTTQYYIYGSETCYKPENGSYSNKRWFEHEGYHIYPASAFLEQKESITKKEKTMQVIKKRTMPVNGLERDITVVVLSQPNGELRAGYAVRLPSDVTKDEIAILIAKGRAEKDRTNLLQMSLGRGMDKKFILHAIADNILLQIKEGKISIKGVKEEKPKTGLTVLSKTDTIVTVHTPQKVRVKDTAAVYEKTRAMVADKLGVNIEEVVKEANLTDDLGADELDHVELIMEAEKDFNIIISDAKAETVRTFGDLLAVITELIK